jgi:hypothetical protein
VVTFDPTRNFNDEVLEQYVIESLELKRADAEVAVKNFVDRVKSHLEQDKEYVFDNICTLKRNNVGQIVLEPADDAHRAGAAFGLEEVEVKERKAPVKASSTVKHTPPKTVAHTGSVSSKTNRSKSGKLLFRLIATLVVIALVVIAGFYFLPEFRFWEDSTPQAIAAVEKPVVNNNMIELDSAAIANDICEDTLEKATRVDQQIKETVAVVTDKKTALFYQEPKPQDSRTYYIISGSYERIENAQVHVDMLKTKGHNPEIIESDGRFRVAMLKFTDRNRALRELERLRKEKPNESVWLLGL